MTDVMTEILQCKERYDGWGNGRLVSAIAPILLTAFRTGKFVREDAIKVSAMIAKMVENVDAEVK